MRCSSLRSAHAHTPSCFCRCGGAFATLQVQETDGMASVMMTCSSASGRWYSRHPAAADLHARPHSNHRPTKCDDPRNCHCD